MEMLSGLRASQYCTCTCVRLIGAINGSPEVLKKLSSSAMESTPLDEGQTGSKWHFQESNRTTQIWSYQQEMASVSCRERGEVLSKACLHQKYTVSLLIWAADVHNFILWINISHHDHKHYRKSWKTTVIVCCHDRNCTEPFVPHLLVLII